MIKKIFIGVIFGILAFSTYDYIKIGRARYFLGDCIYNESYDYIAIIEGNNEKFYFYTELLLGIIPSKNIMKIRKFNQQVDDNNLKVGNCEELEKFLKERN